MLRDYFDPELWPRSALPQAGEELTRQINRLTSAARWQDVPVLWVRQEFEPDLSDAFPHMRKTKRRYTVRGTPGCLLLGDLVASPGDHHIIKKRFSAFHDTKLKATLDHLGVSTVVLAGITTSWCIRTTATDAYQIGYDVILVGDCMAGFTKTDHHESLRAMDGYIGKVVSCDEAISCLRG